MLTNKGNKNATSDFMRVLLATKEASLRDCNVADVVKVVSISGDDYHCKSLTTLNDIQALKLEDLEILQNDVVVVLYTTRDFRNNLRKIKRNQELVDNTNTELHSCAYGIIIGKLYSGGI